MRTVWFIAALLMILSSCKEEAQSLTIQDDNLVDILVDLHIAEEMVNKFRVDQRDSVRSIFLAEISHIHKYSEEEINTNVTVLQSNTEKAFIIYQDVYKKLDKFGKNESDKEKPKKDIDSLKTSPKVKINN